MVRLLPTRSPLAIAALTTLALGATGAGAATLHRFAVTQTTGSEGATTFLQGSSTSSALQGEVNSSPNTAVKFPFGVLGEYNASGSSTLGIGVIGLSTTGYGVGAEALGANPALIAINTGTSDGIQAYTDETSGGHNAVYAEDKSGGNAILAMGDSGNGITGTTTNSGSYGVAGTDDNGGASGFGVYGTDFSTAGQGVHGGSYTGIGVLAHSLSGQSTEPSLLTYSEVSGTDLMDATAYGSDNTPYTTFRLTYPSQNASDAVVLNNGASSDLELDGDIYVAGNVYGDCENPSVRETRANCADSLFGTASSNRGTQYHTYAARQASPTMEDSGELQLVRGFAHVALDPTFASVISTTSPYLVFMTPNGESKGLYVVNKTPHGFDVRENAGGTSTMPVDFRIVAKPFGEAPRRLELVGSRHKVGTPVSATLAAQFAADRRMDAKLRTIKRMTQPTALLKR